MEKFSEHGSKDNCVNDGNNGEANKQRSTKQMRRMNKFVFRQKYRMVTCSLLMLRVSTQRLRFRKKLNV